MSEDFAAISTQKKCVIHEGCGRVKHSMRS